MELWIRSQNKDKLFKINGVDITKMNDNSYEITGYTTYDIYLGKYKTKERALEVLDEIQEHIEKQGENYLLTDKNGIITGQKYYGFIYQMPEE